MHPPQGARLPSSVASTSKINGNDRLKLPYHPFAPSCRRSPPRYHCSTSFRPRKFLYVLSRTRLPWNLTLLSQGVAYVNSVRHHRHRYATNCVHGCAHAGMGAANGNAAVVWDIVVEPVGNPPRLSPSLQTIIASCPRNKNIKKYVIPTVNK